jgi:hypothetical protein
MSRVKGRPGATRASDAALIEAALEEQADLDANAEAAHVGDMIGMNAELVAAHNLARQVARVVGKLREREAEDEMDD